MIKKPILKNQKIKIKEVMTLLLRLLVQMLMHQSLTKIKKLVIQKVELLIPVVTQVQLL